MTVCISKATALQILLFAFPKFNSDCHLVKGQRMTYLLSRGCVAFPKSHPLHHPLKLHFQQKGLLQAATLLCAHTGGKSKSHPCARPWAQQFSQSPSFLPPSVTMQSETRNFSSLKFNSSGKCLYCTQG